MNATNDSSKIKKTWNSGYLLNISMIDKQHAKFFELFDKLLTFTKKEEFYEDLEPVITELEKYTKIHFQTEEALMRKAHSPDFENHIIQHFIFNKKVEEFRIAYSYKNSVLLEQMISFMRKWFMVHIADVDGKYVDSIQKFMIETGRDKK